MQTISYTQSNQFGFQTPVYCIISDTRVYRLKSPRMYNRVLREMGLSPTYVPFMVAPENLGRALESLRILNISGANISVPYKVKASRYMDVLSQGARVIGAINTVVCRQGTLKGYNTNAIGFMDTLAAAGFKVAGKRALIFGSGGAARAMAFILNWLRAEKVIIAGRDKARTWTVADQVDGQGVLLPDLDGRNLAVDIVVNATSVSSLDESREMADRVSRLKIPQCEMIYDLNYGRTENFWRQRARRLGILFLDGVTTLAYQARRTFSLWTGLNVPPEVFLKALQ